MVGLIIEYALYALVAVSTCSTVASVTVAVAMRKGSQASNYFWQSVLSLLAGTSPYIGLFGTVWHIIAALSGIGGGNLNVGEIAKPIGEALNATLWGLGAALISLIGYRVADMIATDESEDTTENK